MGKRLLTLIFFYLCFCPISGQNKVDVLIIGGGAGGTSAGIQAARMGVSVQIIEPTPWLGGMLTSAGVSAIDGNHQMPSGIWGEFREAIYEYYGGPQAVATGWVSHTLFEPSVGNKILQQMANIPNLDIAFNAEYKTISRNGDLWTVSFTQNGKVYNTQTEILIDATEIGEVIPLVGADFRLGMDSQSDTREKEAPSEANNVVQDLTYAVILEDSGNPSKKNLVKKPKNYNSKDYECACKRPGGEMFGAVSDCNQMLNYAKLPNGKYLINWPHCGNDFYVNWPELSESERAEKITEAKLYTQGFVYYLQTALGFKNLKIAKEFPTKDHFPMIPYDREARRIKGKVFLTVDHLEKPYDYQLYRTGGMVGDYPIDHHHDKNPNAPKIEFINIRVPSYNIPLGVLIPERVENFLVAEKNISVSNIVNGATRLQPVVLGIGQAAGALAASAILEGTSTKKVDIRSVQNRLLNSNAYLMPFIDVTVEDSGFKAMQRIGATGILKGYGVPYKWANQTWFYPEQIVSEYEWKEGLLPYFPQVKNIAASGQGITIEFIKEVFSKIDPNYFVMNFADNWMNWGIDQPLEEKTPLNRKSVSILTDVILNPFDIPVDFQGKIILK